MNKKYLDLILLFLPALIRWLQDIRKPSIDKERVWTKPPEVKK